MRLQNKSGIITAAGSGMGRAGALRFAREGAKVAVVDINRAAAEGVVRDIKEAGGQAIALVGDLRDEQFQRGLVRSAADAFGKLDFVWNHCGHPGPAAVDNLGMVDYDLAMDLNLRVSLVITIEAIPHLRNGGGGSVLFTASPSGLVGSPYSPVYSAAKFGLIGMSRSLTKRYGKEKLRFNVICPGTTDTPMIRAFMKRPDDPAVQHLDAEELVAKRAGINPLGRIGKPEEIANAALFLISDEASFVTGAVLAVDGGVTA
jgi:NAD(P)-dependent dehydrogenase (short-subunit alcohol dehydrogenase family)